MSRKVLGRALALFGAAVVIIVLWIAFQPLEIGLSENEIYISENLVDAARTSWTINRGFDGFK